MITQDKVMEALSTCYDPEIPVNIVDLGLVYDVIIQPESGAPAKSVVHVKMSLTSPGCPMAPMIQAQVEDAVSSLEGVVRARVEIVWEPMWTPDRMTPAARLELGMG